MSAFDEEIAKHRAAADAMERRLVRLYEELDMAHAGEGFGDSEESLEEQIRVAWAEYDGSDTIDEEFDIEDRREEADGFRAWHNRNGTQVPQ